MAAERIQGLAAVSQPDAQVLVLGSMPGVASLKQQQYYGHPRNLFWPIMAELCGFHEELAYPARLSALQQHKIALWDVLQHCERQGSLDSAIRNETPNDFDRFLQQHTKLRLIAFNGRKAEQSFRRLVLPKLAANWHCQLLSLPSTSPANAAQSAEQRRQKWQQIMNFL
ncbi:MAG: DNA-deoxyinosine glycosylase [Alkalimonas sp.]|nr:DNA-deoxyinosine glycosylase [Alkalimonas sp.]